MKKFFFILILLCVGASVAFFFSGSAVSRSIAMREAMKKADQIFIYEGLPHQAFEAEQLATEKKRSDVRTIDGFQFYTPQIEVSKDRVEQLKQWLLSEDSYSKFSGEKECGGFHPDYAVVWKGRKGKRDYALLICFGCGEAIFTDGTKQLHYDLNGQVKDELQKWLANYAKKRPARALKN